MARVDYKLTGFDEFEKTLFNMVEVKYPREVQKILFELAEDLQTMTIEKTPEGTEKKAKSRRLKNKWKVGKVKQKNGEFFIELKNNAPHAHLIESGHEIVGKDGSSHGFWEGKQMLLISVKQLEERLEPRLKAWLDRMLGELSL